MKMDINELLELISKGECETIEFKKTITKDIAEHIVAFANALGGYILIGVDDDGNIVGCDEKKVREYINSVLQNIKPTLRVKIHRVKINNKVVVVIEVKRSRVLHTIGNTAFIRIGSSKRPLSIDEILAMSSELVMTEVDVMKTNIPVNKEVNNRIKSFCKEISKRVELKNCESFLKKRRLIINNKLSFAGALFLLKKPQDYFPHTYLRIVFGKKWYLIDGPLQEQVEKAMDILKNILPTVESRTETKREMKGIPRIALREAIVNALVHRNYSIKSEVFVIIKDSRVIVQNPGSFPPNVNVDNPNPFPRNPTIYEFMFLLGYVEKQGEGINIIRQLCLENNIKVDFDIRPNITRVVFSLQEETGDNALLEFLRIPRTSNEVAEFLKVSKPTAVKTLNKLISTGRVVKRGKGPRTRYVLS